MQLSNNAEVVATYYWGATTIHIGQQVSGGELEYMFSDPDGECPFGGLIVRELLTREEVTKRLLQRGWTLE